MISWLVSTTGLSAPDVATLAAITFGAGMIRGFSGFALSALVMAAAVSILPPIELIPMLWWLEMSASLVLVRRGWADADLNLTKGLVLGALIGWPMGLALTVFLPVETSKIIALCLILALAISLLAKINLPFLATRSGLYGTGAMAGIASGLAHVGGMVVAFYVLAAQKPARVMRASLVLYLFIGSMLSMFTLLAFGVMDWQGAYRGLVFAVPTVLGTLLGQALFSDRLAPYYRPFCLILLISIALIGLGRAVST